MRTILLVLLFLAPLPSAMAEELSGYTQMMYEGQHGTQIEYLAEGGEAFPRYPGNRVVLKGRWALEDRDICFAYGQNTFNPVTGHQGGGWECMPFELYGSAVAERMRGDVFALENRRAVPFSLDPQRTTLEQLLSRSRE